MEWNRGPWHFDKKIMVTHLCPSCDLVVESTAHALFWCKSSKADFQCSQNIFIPKLCSSSTIPCVNWVSPPHGLLKLNSDVAVKQGGEFIGIELLALRGGLLLAEQLDFSVGLVEVDAVNVVASVNSFKLSSCFAGFVIEDIQVFCRDIGVQKCFAIPRLGNSLAHNLASLAFSFERDSEWQEICPR
ncbi:hypothetical protein ACOSP7_019064 [Xanthoceras sorbifolium]